MIENSSKNQLDLGTFSENYISTTVHIFHFLHEKIPKVSQSFSTYSRPVKLLSENN